MLVSRPALRNPLVRTVAAAWLLVYLPSYAGSAVESDDSNREEVEELAEVPRVALTKSPPPCGGEPEAGSDGRPPLGLALFVSADGIYIRGNAAILGGCKRPVLGQPTLPNDGAGLAPIQALPELLVHVQSEYPDTREVTIFSSEVLEEPFKSNLAGAVSEHYLAAQDKEIVLFPDISWVVAEDLDEFLAAGAEEWTRQVIRSTRDLTVADCEPSSSELFEIKEFFHRKKAQVTSCFEMERRRDPGLTGAVTAEWALDQEGHPDEIEFPENTTGSVDLVDCVQRRLNGWWFPGPGAGCTMRYRFEATLPSP